MPSNDKIHALRDRLEMAARASWPALEERRQAGWLLRFADGYTRRSNSIYPLSSPPGDLVQRVADCEQIFRHQGLTPSFRMTGFQGPADLDPLLETRGYERITPTFVLHRLLRGREQLSPASVTRDEPSVEEWIATFAALNGTPEMRIDAHQAILAATPEPRCLAVALRDGHPIACGLAVLVDGCCGIFDVVTAPEERQRGFGTELMRGLLDWGREHGATDAYLQVLQANRPALRLYEKLAFENCYEYWYRVLSPVPPPSDSRLRRSEQPPPAKN